MQLDDACTELRYAKDWSKQSAQWYTSRLGLFVSWCKAQDISQLEQITPQLVRRYIEYLKTRPAKRSAKLDSFTVHGHIRAIRTLLFWAAAEELIDEKIPRRIALPKRDQKVLRVLSQKQIGLLLAVAAKTPTPLRDTALVLLLLDSGCRASEICTLEVSKVFFEQDRAYLIVYGKGRKERPVMIGKAARLALWKYIRRERQSDTQLVFIGKRGPLTTEGLERLMYRLRDAAGRENFEGVKVAPHRWRHTCAVMKLKSGEDIYAVSKGLGHSDISVTTNYLKGMDAMEIMALSKSPVDQMSKAG